MSVFFDALDDVELVERVVETHLGDRRAGNRREQRAAQAVAQCVAEARLERRDREALQVAFDFAGLDLRTLDDQHESLLFGSGCSRTDWLSGDWGYFE